MRKMMNTGAKDLNYTSPVHIRTAMRILIVVIGLTGSQGYAATNTWTNSIGDNAWETVNNWSRKELPRSGDDIVISPLITKPGPLTFRGTSGAASIDDLSMGANTLNITAGAMTITGAITGTRASTLTIGGGTVSLNGSKNATLGVLNMNGGTLQGTRSGFTVQNDYNNTAFGVGNAFNRHANVAAGMSINAAGSAPKTYQQLSIDNGVTKTNLNLSTSIGTIVHVGDTVQKNLQIYNMSGSGGVTLRGAIQDAGTGSNWMAAAGQSVSRDIAFNTASAGLISTSVNIVNNFDNTNNQTFTMTGTVNDYAKLGVSEYQGKGTLRSTGTAYEIDLGSILQGKDSANGRFSLLNVGGSANFTDLLAGSFATNGSSSINISGFNSFSGIAGGKSHELAFSVDTDQLGAFSQTLTLSYYGYNADYTGSLEQVSFVIKGDLIAAPVPEPETWGMLLVGLGVIGMRARAMKNRFRVL